MTTPGGTTGPRWKRDEINAAPAHDWSDSLVEWGRGTPDTPATSYRCSLAARNVG